MPLLDLTNIEESDLPNLTVAVLPRTGKITLLTLETRIHVDRFEQMFQMAGAACKVMHGEMTTAVQRRTEKLVKAMGKGRDLQDAASAPNANDRIRDMDIDLDDY